MGIREFFEDLENCEKKSPWDQGDFLKNLKNREKNHLGRPGNVFSKFFGTHLAQSQNFRGESFRVCPPFTKI
jgi:hypothetical protein